MALLDDHVAKGLASAVVLKKLMTVEEGAGKRDGGTLPRARLLQKASGVTRMACAGTQHSFMT